MNHERIAPRVEGAHYPREESAFLLCIGIHESHAEMNGGRWKDAYERVLKDGVYICSDNGGKGTERMERWHVGQ